MAYIDTDQCLYYFLQKITRLNLLLIFKWLIFGQLIFSVMKKSLRWTMLLCALFLMSCNSKKGSETDPDDKVGLVADKQIVFPLDERTYYLSKSMFQFEENGREYLYFENTRKSLYDIVVFDIATGQIAKRIPMSKTGPNGLPAVYGSIPFPDSKSIMLSQNNISRFSFINDRGEVIRNYTISAPGGGFTYLSICSYYHMPAFGNDSCVYFQQSIPKPDMKREDWPQTHMFASLDLKTGQFKQLPLFYPPLFQEEYANVAGGYRFSYDYNYKEGRLVCGFFGYDSLMVTDDLKHIQWYNGKSKYLKSMRPKLRDSMSGLKSIVESHERPKYWHVMYDKYRDVYYRFVEMPYELAPDESPYDEPRGKEFSVIVLNNQFEIIGETKFPGKKYFYKMCFVGRDGLYISENNLANPDFDEDKLVFTCFKIKETGL